MLFCNLNSGATGNKCKLF